MCENVLSILESLSHLVVITFKCLVKWLSGSFALFVDVCDKSAFRIEKNLSVILEVYLYNLIAKPEHDCMLCSHPFLHIN